MSIDLMEENGLTLKSTRSRQYPSKTISDTDYADDILLLANTSTQAKSLLHSLDQAVGGIDLHVNADKTEYMCFNQKRDIFTLKNCSLKVVNKFTYLGSNVSSNENDINIWHAKATNRLLITWKSNLSDTIKWNFFQAAVVSIILYRCSTWTLTNCIEKKKVRNCTRMI